MSHNLLVEEMLILLTHVLYCVAGRCNSEENGKQSTSLCDRNDPTWSHEEGKGLLPLTSLHEKIDLLYLWFTWYCHLTLSWVCLWPFTIDYTSKPLLSFLISWAPGFDQHLKLILKKPHSFSNQLLDTSSSFVSATFRFLWRNACTSDSRSVLCCWKLLLWGKRKKQLSCLCESSANNGANFEPLGGTVICFHLIHSIKMWILYCILGLLDNVTCLWAESASDLCVDHTSKLLLSFLMSGAASFDQHLKLILRKLHRFSSLLFGYLACLFQTSLKKSMSFSTDMFLFKSLRHNDATLMITGY